MEGQTGVIGKTLAHYEIEAPLGAGGSGIVYRARDVRLERLVAIKVLSDTLRDDEFAWARLLREARLASQLTHPHIAATYDLGEEDGRSYIVMEYVEGLALADVIPEGGMTGEQLMRYARQIADALAYAHERGVVHGDLKGSNIVVTPEGNIKLLDFGLGRRVPRQGMSAVTSSRLPLAEAGATAGTLPYLAPEVLRGGPTTVESDEWALGVLLYQMATGELPFGGATPFEMSVAIMAGTPARLGQLAEPLGSVVRRCLEKEAAARYGRVEEVAAALEAARQDSEALAAPATASPLSRGEKPGRHHSRYRLLAAAVALGVCLLAGAYARPVWVSRQPPFLPQSTSTKPGAEAKPNVRVWVNTNSGTFHCPGTRWYGKTAAGKYMTQKEALEGGYRPAGNRPCR